MKIFLTLFISLACCLSLTAQSKNAEKAFNKGLDFYQEQAYSEAINEFKAVIWVDPDHEAAHHFLSKIYTEQGKTSYAIKHLKRVLAINSDREDSWVELAKAYAANEQSEKAVSTLERAIKINNGYLSAKLELDNLLNPPFIVEPIVVEEDLAYEPVDLKIQPPSTSEMVSIDDEPSILLEELAPMISPKTYSVIIPIFEETEMAVTKPIQKEEVMAPAPTREKSRKAKKVMKETAGPAEKEEMATAILNELLPAFENDESFEEVEIVENIVKTDANLTKQDVVINVTVIEEIDLQKKENVEELSEEVVPVQEEIIPSYSSTPRIPGIRMPSAVDHVIKAQDEKRLKKRKN